jgi:hypothetical protein
MEHACGQACETARWFGVAGVCNNATGRCDCPEGYSGEDDWGYYASCHVPVVKQRIIWTVHLGLHAALTLVAVAGMLWLAYHWNFMSAPRLSRRLSHGVESASLPHFDGSESPSRTKSASARKNSLVSHGTGVDKHVWRRQRDTLCLLSLVLLFSTCGLVYVGSFFAGVFRFEYVWYKDAALALAAPSVICSLWGAVYVWYRSLPSLRLYGRLFQFRSLLIDYPRAVRNVTFLMIAAMFVTSVGTLFVVPRVTRDPVALERANNFLCVFVMLDLVAFCLLFTSLLALLHRIFTEVKTISASGPHLDLAPIEQTLHTVHLMLIAELVIAPATIALFAETAFTEFGQQNRWLLVNAVFIAGVLTGAMTYFIFVVRLSGPTTRRATPSDSLAAGMV